MDRPDHSYQGSERSVDHRDLYPDLYHQERQGIQSETRRQIEEARINQYESYGYGVGHDFEVSSMDENNDKHKADAIARILRPYGFDGRMNHGLDYVRVFEIHAQYCDQWEQMQRMYGEEGVYDWLQSQNATQSTLRGRPFKRLGAFFR